MSVGPSALEESSLTGRLYIIGGYLNLEFKFYGEFCKIEFFNILVILGVVVTLYFE